MPSARDDIPSSRLARTAMLGGLVAEQSAKYAGTAAANLARPRADRKVAIERRHLQAADQLLAVLGTMKGPAMKVGQMLSFMDLGVLPEDVRPRFQQRLASLCAEAPEIPWSRMEPVLNRVLAGPVSATFREFDTAPVGTASIGQVYRATTLDGREVAVKVQYPDIVAAARADLKNLGMVLRFGQSFASSVDTKALAKELTARFLEELDYTREAANTAKVAVIYSGHPFIYVPAPVLELCRPEMVVTDYVAGTSFADACTSPAAHRDRLGEIIGRFYLGSLFRSSVFSGDPHPGNIIEMADGRVAFLDFGSARTLTTSEAQFVRALLGAILEGDFDMVLAHFVNRGMLGRPDAIAADMAADFVADTCGWFQTDGSLTMTPRMTSDAILASVAPAGGYQGVLHGQELPVEWSLLVRAMIATTALLGQLGATGNWHRTAREWAFDDAPSTPLGVQERAFLATREASS